MTPPTHDEPPSDESTPEPASPADPSAEPASPAADAAPTGPATAGDECAGQPGERSEPGERRRQPAEQAEQAAGPRAPGTPRPRRTAAGGGGGRSWWAAVGVGVAALVAVVVAVALRRPPGPFGEGERVVLYGDSLSVEAGAPFAEKLAADTDAEVEVRAAPGTAVCDALGQIRDDLADPTRTPAVAVLEFAGNNFTPCVRTAEGDELTGPELAARYAADTREAVELLAGAGARVVITGPPAAPGLPGDATDLIDAEYERIVTEWAGRDIGRVRYAAAGATVAGHDGGFAAALPCRDDEGEAEGCRDGRIAVRSPDEIHFCPQPAGDSLACPVYASGAERFGHEMARVATQALDPNN